MDFDDLDKKEKKPILSGVDVTIYEHGGTARSIQVAVTELDSSSATLLTRGYIHPNSQCEIHLPTMAIGLTVRAQGKVSKCEHHSGTDHLVTLAFRKPIDVAAVIATSGEPDVDAVQRAQYEQIDVLLLDAWVTNHEIISSQLSPFSVRLTAAEHSGMAIDLLKHRRFQAMLIDYQLGDETGLTAYGRICPAYFTGPVVFITDETSPAAHRSMLEVGAPAVLIKPIDGGTVAAALHESIRGSVADPIRQYVETSAVATKPRSRMIDELQRLCELLQSNDIPEDLSSLCRSISSSAACCGLTLLARTASHAHIALECGVQMHTCRITDLKETLDATMRALEPKPLMVG